MFLIIYSEDIPANDLLCFSPHLMQWDENFWIIDQSLTASYWQKRALSQKLNVPEMLRTILNHLSQDWTAVLSENIFQGVLMTRTLRKRKLRGLLNASEAFGQSFLKQVEWETWFHEAKRFGKIYEGLSSKGFRPATFWKGLKHFEQAVARLSTNLNWYLQNISPASIQRRFGSDVAKVWTHTKESPESLTTFPWVEWKTATPPQVRRISESVLCAWDHMEGFLREDFDRLIKSVLENEGISSYTWTLHLTNGKEMKVPVHFRIPHLLYKEKGNHKSSLAQCSFVFDRFKKQMKDDHEEFIGIEGWTLEISHKLFLPTWLRSLFSTEQDVNMEKILALENLLPHSLQIFDITHEWIPEKSFKSNGVATSSYQPHRLHRPYFKKRPLFIYDKAEPYDLSHARGMFFLERISNHWWDSAEEGIERDYYRVKDRYQRDLWVYLERKNGEVKAFTQGTYG